MDSPVHLPPGNLFLPEPGSYLPRVQWPSDQAQISQVPKPKMGRQADAALGSLCYTEHCLWEE